MEQIIMTNQKIARIFYEMGALHEMKNERFKARAYDKAALLIENLPQEIEEIYSKDGLESLINLPGMGKRIAEHIEMILKKGTFRQYEMLKKGINVNVSELLKIEGVGPRNIKTLWEKLKIKNIEDLEKAARAGKIRKLENFGEKSEKKILEGIEFLKKTGGRKLLGQVLPRAWHLKERMELFEGIERVEIAGSLRRKKETVGDVDILASSKHPERVIEQFIDLPEVIQVIAKGKTKASVKLVSGMNADLRVVEDDSFGSALLYFTGSQSHNIKLRHIALTKGWKLNEYGLFDGDKNLMEGKNERDIYKKLGLEYIEPELREDIGEVEAALQGKLPKLVDHGDLKGDLQVQTKWSDGKNSIGKMAAAAMERGLEYIAITDHSKSLIVANGLDRERLLLQMKEIDRIDVKLKKQEKKFRILRGIEVDILKDGTLDLDDEILSKLDVVGASIHNYFDLPRPQQTERLVRAMKNPNVDIIFHLTTRVIGTRKPIDIDMEKILQTAKETKTVLEIDSFVDRLDISEQYIRRCAAEGIKMSIDSDAHMVEHYDYLEYGISQARRGWASKKDVINAWPLEKMLKMLK